MFHTLQLGVTAVLNDSTLYHPIVIVSEMNLADLSGRRVPLIGVIAILFLSTVVTVAALTIYASSVEKINIWGGQVQDTDFTLDSTSTKIKGKNKIEVTVTITNSDDSNPHTASVTVQLLDAAGDILVEETIATGSVLASATWSDTFVLTAEELVASYDSPYVIIYQTA